ncbi:glycoside hydrolase family 18 protein [Athelia psychrophila]|uniref:Glycoside hydrolase family 18 protein n=1 Tax=Athelia psychrophila TaxID=1759441 RepID=A0A167XRV5_9AGAM|nr:glycoside hydrolase family 18 protein [Fibularhizoctonia sp. CBS 109695]
MDSVVPPELTAELTQLLSNPVLGDNEIRSQYRARLACSYNAAGISMIVSAFGSIETPAESGIDPTLSAQNLVAWAKEYDMDGVDVDFEDLAAFNGGTGSAEN